VVLGAFILAFASVPARAGFYLGARGGVTNQNAKAGEIEFDRDSTFFYGAQAGFKFSGFAIEGQFYHADHTLLSEAESLEQAVDYNYFGFAGKLGISLAIVYPYLTVGYGTYAVELNEIGKESDWGWNAGAGIELLLGKIGIFGELKYTDFNVTFDTQEWDFGGLDLHFGLNIHF
jgi:hypothetical protein